MAPPDPGLSQGDVLDGKYVVRDRIGCGGMGSVFLADQPALERTVAIKILRRDVGAPGGAGAPGDTSLAHAEAVTACHVRSPHCVAVIDCGALPDGTPYLVMEYVPGRSLGRIIAEEPIALARTVDLFEQVLSALGATHDSGIVHGDVKSDNFMVELLRGTEHVTMIDFGLARIAGSAARTIGDDGNVWIAGTPEYMAPEVIRGEPPACASDLYGAGVILYELLTGTTPFGGGEAADVVLRHVNEAVEPPSRRRPDWPIPPAFDQLVLRALDKRPEARFPDAAGFARELRTAAIRSQLESRPRNAARRARRGTSPGSQDGDPGRVEQLRELRCLIGDALAHGDAARVADGYLAVAQLFRDSRRYAAAAAQLEEGIDLLTAGGGPVADPGSDVVDRLVVALRALYEAGVARHSAPPRSVRPALRDAG